jgi:hypothetical protein
MWSIGVGREPTQSSPQVRFPVGARGRSKYAEFHPRPAPVTCLAYQTEYRGGEVVTAELHGSIDL